MLMSELRRSVLESSRVPDAMTPANLVAAAPLAVTPGRCGENDRLGRDGVR